MKARGLTACLVLLGAPLWAAAQERAPLSSGAQIVRAGAPPTEEAKTVGEAPKPRVQAVAVPAFAPGERVSSGNAAIDLLVHEAARAHGLDPYLIFSVMRQESGFDRDAVSPKGASGLMQLMPATAARFGVKDIFDARENIFAGAKYLRWLLDRFGGDVRLALAGYNAGEGAVESYGWRIPPYAETQHYVRTIYAAYSRLRGLAVAEPGDEPASPERAPSHNQIVKADTAGPLSVKPKP